MKYINPPNCDKIHSIYHIVKEKTGYRVYNEINEPWLPLRNKQSLNENELTITYYSHACVKIKCGNKIIYTDPWLTGPAFMKGWWLLHKPPTNWVEDISNADFIFISHSHSDHLSIPTLNEIAQKNENVKVIVGDLKVPVFNQQAIFETGLKNINPMTLSQWHDIDINLRIMILPDGMWETLDTCLLIDYKGYLIFLNVDCSNPNNFILPKTDVTLSSFAGGASGYPCAIYGEKYTNEHKKEIINHNLKKELNAVVDLLKFTQSSIYIPYAGYFIESESEYIRKINLKNSPDDVEQFLKRYNKDINVWKPLPGKIIDISNGKTLFEGNVYDYTYPHPKHEIQNYNNKIDQYINRDCFRTISGFEHYFKWANFKNYDMIMLIMETDDVDENNIVNQFYVDYIDASVTYKKPTRVSKYYIEMKVDIGCFRKTIFNGEAWDGLYIGFQMRWTRNPDVYHIKFWEHFFTKLPLHSPFL